MTHQNLKAITAAIADVIFRSIDPEAQYVVIEPDQATKFTTDRLMSGMPANIVGHRDDPAGRPIRDSGIYRVSPYGTGHNHVAEGWVELLTTSGTAVLKAGDAINVDEIWAAALVEVMARIEQSEEDQ